MLLAESMIDGRCVAGCCVLFVAVVTMAIVFLDDR